MASYTQRMVSIAQAIKSTTPNVARKAPLVPDPPCSVVISSSNCCFGLHERGLADAVSFAAPRRSHSCPAPGSRGEDHGTSGMDTSDQPGAPDDRAGRGRQRDPWLL